ncbi:hypothetical protein [Mesorhizobium sp. B1-1-6]|nr:hypothetical protein [Mesorhizobium sp. B1-1-6]
MTILPSRKTLSRVVSALEAPAVKKRKAQAAAAAVILLKSRYLLAMRLTP